MHNGASCHRTGAIKKLVNDIGIEELITWPGNSPDLKRIENLWSIIKHKVNRSPPTSTGDLQDLILHEWNFIDMNIIQNLISSTPK